MTIFAFDFDDLDTRTIRRIGFMTSDTWIDTFATTEPEFMTFFTFGIVGAGVIQVILVWVLGGYGDWFVLWMEDFLDFTGFLFFGKFGVGINLADFLTGFFVHIGGLFCLGCHTGLFFNFIYVLFYMLLVKGINSMAYGYSYNIYAIRPIDQLFATTPV
jgi:hypothetical protein